MNSLSRLTFQPNIVPQVLDEHRVVLLTEASGKYILKGRIYSRLVSLLDGSRTMDEIVEILEDEESPEKVYLALMTLERKRFIGPRYASATKDQSAFWSGIEIEPDLAMSRLANSAVALLPIGETSDEARALSTTLQSLNVPIVEQCVASLVVVTVLDYLLAELASVNKEMRASQTNWMPVKVIGQVPWIGPIFTPSSGPCWECLACRLRSNRTEEMVVEAHSKHHPVLSRAALPVTRSLAVQLAALEIAKYIALNNGATAGNTIRTFDTRTLELSAHEVRPLPDCPVCGEEPVSLRAVAPSEPLILQSRQKRFTADGGHRVCSPEETFARLAPLISSVSGIAPELRRVQTAGELHVYQVKQNAPASAARHNRARLGEPDGAAGKGQTDIQAKVSCVAEAIERYSCVFRGDEPRRHAHFSQLGADAVHPNSLLNFSAHQYACRETWNKSYSGFNWIPEPFNDSKEIDWTPAWSLTHQRRRWLPTAFCYFMHGADQAEFCRGDSNGCAAGNNLEEAILQGFLELVERDSMALFWYNRLRRPEILLDSFRDPFFDRMVQYFNNRRRTLVALDLTSDLDIPTVAAVSANKEGRQILIGLGTHLDARIAVSRAITELNQMLPVADLWDAAAEGERDDLGDGHISDWLRTASLANQPYLVPDPTLVRRASHFVNVQNDDLLNDVQFCVKTVAEKGMEMIVLDLTRRDTGLATARVIVPGLRHFWARFAPGRLYDVPVTLGWLPSRLKETELNPIPFFL